MAYQNQILCKQMLLLQRKTRKKRIPPTPSLSPSSNAPSSVPSLGPPVPVGTDPHSRSIVISRAGGTVVATSHNKGPLRMEELMGERDRSIGFPGGLVSMDAVTMDDENGILFGLSVGMRNNAQIRASSQYLEDEEWSGESRPVGFKTTWCRFIMTQN